MNDVQPMEDYAPTMLKAVIGGKAARKETEEQASVQLHSCAKKSYQVGVLHKHILSSG